MTMAAGSDEATINDARALLREFARSQWQELYLVNDGLEIFIARQGGGANPMTTAAAPAPAPRPEAVNKVQLSTPHVATLLTCAAEGAALKAGDVAATLELLDETVDVLAPVAGRVSLVSAASGSLLEFGAPILVILKYPQ